MTIFFSIFWLFSSGSDPTFSILCSFYSSHWSAVRVTFSLSKSSFILQFFFLFLLSFSLTVHALLTTSTTIHSFSRAISICICWSCTCTAWDLLPGVSLNCSAHHFSSSAAMCSSSFFTDWLLSWSSFHAPYSMDISCFTVCCLSHIRGIPGCNSGITSCLYTSVCLFLNLDIRLCKTIPPSSYLLEQAEWGFGLIGLLLYSIHYLIASSEM